MSWILQNTRDLMTGQKVGTLLKEIMDTVGPAPKAVSGLIDFITKSESPDAVALAEYLLGDRKDADRYIRFISRLEKLEQRPLEERKFSWDGLTYTGKVEAKPALSLNLSTGAEIGFEILGEDGETAPTALDETLIRFDASGHLRGSMALAGGGLGTSLSVDVQRSLSWLFGFDQDNYLFEALANSLTRVAHPFFEFSEVLAASNGPPLWAGGAGKNSIDTPASLKSITYGGSLTFTGKSDAKLGIAGGAGAVSIGFSAFANLSHDFKLVVTPSDDAKGLAVDLALNSSEERGYDLSVGYKLGLSVISPGLAGQLLSRISRVDGFLKDLEGKVGSARQDLLNLVKPGTWLETKFTSAIDKFLETSGNDRVLKQVVAAIFKEGGTGTLKQQAQEWLRRAFDDVEQLPVPTQLKKFKEDALAGLDAELAESVGILIDDTFGTVAAEVQASINALATKIDKNALSQVLGQKVTDITKALNELLALLRSWLGKISKAVQEANENLIGISWARTRKRTGKTSFKAKLLFDAVAARHYHDLILLPEKTLPALVSTKPDGVIVLKDEFTAVFQDLTKDVFGLNILSFGISASTELVTDLEVSNAAGVVNIESKGRYEKTRTFFNGDKRWLTISDLLTVGTVEAARLEIAFRQKEKDWADGELDGVIDGFDGNGVTIDAVTKTEMKQFYNQALAQAGQKAKLPGSISAVLTLDSDIAIRLIRAAAQASPAELHSRAALTLVQSQQLREKIEYWFNAQGGSLGQTLRPFVYDLDKLSPAVKRENGKSVIDWNRLFQPDDGAWADFLHKLYEDHRMDNAYKPLREFQLTAWKAFRGLEWLHKFFQAANKALDIAQQFKANPSISGATLLKLRDDLDMHQTAALSALEPWTDVGQPVGDKQKSLPIALINIFQDFAMHYGAPVRPDVFFTFDFGANGKRLFIDSLD